MKENECYCNFNSNEKLEDLSELRKILNKKNEEIEQIKLKNLIKEAFKEALKELYEEILK